MFRVCYRRKYGTKAFGWCVSQRHNAPSYISKIKYESYNKASLHRLSEGALCSNHRISVVSPTKVNPLASYLIRYRKGGTQLGEIENCIFLFQPVAANLVI
jgi:hypothetical protein